MVEVWAGRRGENDVIKVTEAEFVLVAVDATGRPRPVPPESGPINFAMPE
jgi:acyl-CoA hydrolase